MFEPELVNLSAPVAGPISFNATAATLSSQSVSDDGFARRTIALSGALWSSDAFSLNLSPSIAMLGKSDRWTQRRSRTGRAGVIRGAVARAVLEFRSRLPLNGTRG